jgi:hypothetical protein
MDKKPINLNFITQNTQASSYRHTQECRNKQRHWTANYKYIPRDNGHAHKTPKRRRNGWKFTNQATNSPDMKAVRTKYRGSQRNGWKPNIHLTV